MKLEDCAKIDGWMTLEELLWLSERAREHKVIVEVGSWLGRSTAALAETTGIVFAVDTWEGSPEHLGELAGVGRDWAWGQFNSNLGPEINSGKVVRRRMTSRLAAGSWLAKDRPDMVFLDAAHDYESVKADIMAWGHILSFGGLLCGHDYGNGTDDGVEKAVRECVPGFRLIDSGRILANESIWYRYKESAATDEKGTVYSEHRELRPGNHGDNLPAAEALCP